MPDTMLQVVAGVRTLLRRPSEQKLPTQDIRERADDCLRALVQEAQLEGRDQRTVVTDVTLSPDTIDYTIDLDVSDFEPVRLERGLNYPNIGQAWTEVALVPFNAWEKHFNQDYVAGAIYGGEDGRTRIKLNLDSTEFGLSYWRLSYRPSLLTILQLGDRPPLPAHFVPMLKLGTATGCIPIVRDDSAEWIAWAATTLPQYALEFASWRERWKDYLNHSLEPNTVPIRPFNGFRRGNRRRLRAYLPIGS